MFGDDVATRFEFDGQRIEDVLVHRIAGHRLSDGAAIQALLFQEASGIGQAQGLKIVESARKVAELGLSQVPALLEAGLTPEGSVYAIFEQPDLPSLKAVISERGGISPSEALDVVHAVCAVLDRTSSAGLAHLNLSSSSIFCNVGSGEPLKVRIDGFGLGQVMPAYSPMKKTSPYYGTAEYMSPEVCSGRPGSASSDLYAIGCLMYEMVYEKPPFVSTTASTTIKRQVYEKPLPLHLVKPGLPQLDAYEGLLNRLLAKDPTGRPATAAEVMDAVSALRQSTFFDVSLVLEDPRNDYPEPVSRFIEETPFVQPSVSEQLVGGGQTMAFEGLGDAVAQMIRSQEEQPSAAAQAAAEEPMQKTEAFDASFIASVVEKAAAGADIDVAVEEAKTEILRPVGDLPVEDAPKPQSEPVAQQTSVKKKKGHKATREIERKPRPVTDEGLSAVVLPGVEKVSKGPLPSSQTISVRKKPDRKGAGPLIAILVLLILIIAAIVGVLWMKSRKATAVAPEQAAQVEQVAQPAARVDSVPPAPAPEPAPAAEAAAPVPAPAEPAAPPPEPAPAEPAPAAQPEAGKVAETAPVAPAPVVQAGQRQDQARVPPPPRQGRRAAQAEQPAQQQPEPAAERAPAAKPEPAPSSPDDGVAQAAGLRAKARKAGKDGDYAAAISLLKRAKELDPENKLDDKFITAWQKKLDESAK
ncbi:MAG TPA: protein kinase [Myxococcota bacterium]|nr:protein kinase [Myxococcota bacterium]HOA13242.1 protein kinase [Myxococcota bacterium]HPV03027.1 protein kinase [Myxococcota bacterium]